MEPVFVFLILIPIGVAMGIFGALTGLGGGVLMVPILFFGIFEFSNPLDDSIKYATTISSAVIIFIAMSGTVAFSLQKRIDYLIGLLCIPFTIAGSYLGKYVQSLIDETYVLIFIAALLFFTGARMIYKTYIKNKKKKQAQITRNQDQTEGTANEKSIINSTKEPSRIRLLLDKLTLHRTFSDNCNKDWDYDARLYFTPMAFIGGFVASMAGVGGGIIMVPVLNLLCGLPIHFATATSIFIMIFTKIATMISAYTTPTITEGIWWPYVIGLAVGVIGGAQIGAFIAKRIKADSLMYVFASVIIVISIWTIIDWQLMIT